MEKNGKNANDGNYRPIDRIDKYTQYLLLKDISLSFQDSSNEPSEWMLWAEHITEIFDKLLNKALPKSIYNYTLEKNGLCEPEANNIRKLIEKDIRKDFNIVYLNNDDEEKFFNALMDIAFYSIKDGTHIGDIKLEE